MIITSAEYDPYLLKLKIPFSTSKGIIKERRGFILRLIDQSGNTAQGDICPLEDFGSESLSQAEHALNDFIKNEADKIEINSIKEIEDYLSAYRSFPSVSHGIEQALLNLLALQEHKSIAALLNLELRSSIEVNAVIGFLSPEETFAKAEEYLFSGFNTIKIKAGRREFLEDLECIAALRRAVGESAAIRVDVNGKWNYSEALRFIKELDRFNIEYIEQPVREKIELIKLAREVAIPIAADESVRSIDDAMELINSRSIKALILKPMMIGGLLNTLKIIAEAEKAGVKTVVTASFESPVGMMTNIIAAAAVKGNTAHGLNTADFFEGNIFENEFEIINGRIFSSLINKAGVDFLFLNKHVEADEKQSAITAYKNNLTYADLLKAVHSCTEKLKASGIQPGEHAAILSSNSEEFIVLVLSLWKVGAVPVPLNTRLTDQELNDLLTHSDSVQLFTDEDNFERFNEVNLPCRRTLIPGIDLQVDSTAVLNISVNPADVALMMYTSGTTGNPKGVMLSFNNLINSAENCISLLGQSKDDRWLASLPFYHIGGFSIIIRALLKGSSVVIPYSLKEDALYESLNTYKVTLASFVGATLKRLTDNKLRPDAEFRYLLLGGGHSDDEIVKSALSLGWNIIKVYGSTETSSLVCAVNVNENPDKISSSGKALGNNEVIITDEAHNKLNYGKRGEILVKSPSVFRGYYKEPELTEEKFADDYFCTGDIGYLDNEKYLFIEMRRTDLIVSGGENINPVEIEKLLLQNPAVKDVSVFSLPDKEWGEVCCAAVVKNNEVTPEEIISFLRGKAAAYKIPRKIYFLDSIPRTFLGKARKDEIIRLTAAAE